MAKKHSVLTNNDLHNPKGILVESTASMFVMSQSISTATASFHFIPDDTDTYTLGNTARAWKELYVSTGSIHFVEKDGTVARTLEVDATGFGFGGGDVSGSTISGSKLHIVGDAFIGGDLTLGDADTDSISIGADITSNLIPNADATYDLGSSSQGWNDIHLGSGGVINLDGGDVTLTHAAGKVTLGGDGAVEFDFANHEMTNVDVNSGAIDGTAIGAASHTTIKGTTIDATTDFTIGGTVITDNTITDDGTLVIASTTATSFSEGNITNVGSIALDSIAADDGSSFTISNNWTNAGNTIADLGTVSAATSITATDLIGTNVDGILGADTARAITGTTIDATTDFTIDGLVLTADTITNDDGLSIIAGGSGDITLDPAGNNVLPGSDSADDLGASGTAWAKLWVDDIDLAGQGSISIGGTGRIDLNASDDSSIRASDDDTITFEANGTDIAQMTSTMAISGSTISTGSFGYLNIVGDAVIGGNLTFGDAATDNVSFSADVSSSLIPNNDDAFDLGSSGQQWKDLYVDGVAYIDTIGSDGDPTTSAYIAGGEIDATVIGSETAAAITGTTIDATTDFTIGGTVITDNTITDDGTLVIASTTATSFSDGNITNVGDIALDTISADDGSSLSFSNNWTNAGRTVADLGSVTTVDINGGTIDGATIGAASHTTIKGTTIDATTDFTIGSTVITDDSIVMTPSTSDTITFSGATNGALAITTVDDAAAAANITITADGTFEAIGTTVTLDSGGAINLEPAAGSAILLDGTISVDAGVVTGATSITSTDLIGTNVDGILGADTARAITGTTIDATTDFTIGDTVVTDGVITDSTGLQLAANLDINGTADISGDLTLSAGGDGALRFSAASSIKILDNSATALVIEEADNAYITFNTTDSSEQIVFGKNSTFNGTTIADLGTVSAATSITATDLIGTNVDGILGADTARAITGTTIDATTDFTIGGTVITDNTITDDGTLVIASTTATSFSEGNITNVGDIALDTISADDGSSLSFSNNWTNAGNTVADLGSVTTVDINGGTINGLDTDLAVADGGTGASTLTDGGILLGSGTSAVTAMSVLADGEFVVGDGSTDPVAESGDTARISMGVGSTDTWQITGLQIGHASDTTLTRPSAGDLQIESNIIYRAGGTDVAVADGGTGASTLTDGGVLLGSGTGAVTAMAVLADSEMIVGDGSTDPVAESGATLRTSIGVGTTDSVNFGAMISGSNKLYVGTPSSYVSASDGGLKVTGAITGSSVRATNLYGQVATAAQTTITSVINDGLTIGGYSSHQIIDFGTDDMIKVSVNDVADEFRFSAGGTFHADADVVAYSSTTASDISLKKNITDTKYGLDDIMKLRGVDYDWRREDMGHDVGVLAQEVEKVIPEIVKEYDGMKGREKFKAVDYNKLVPVLIESIKTLKTELEDLKKKVN